MRSHKKLLPKIILATLFFVVSFFYVLRHQQYSPSKKRAIADYINLDISDVNDTGNHSLSISTGQINSNFVTAGSAFETGVDGNYSLTQYGGGGPSGQQGYTVFKNQIDMTKNWSLDFNLKLHTITSYPYIGGDFIGLILTPATQRRLMQQTDRSITGINTAASNLGIASLPSTTIWGLDFYNNSKAQKSLGYSVPTNPLDNSYSGDWWNFGNTSNFLETVAGFRHTYGEGSPYSGRLVNSFNYYDDGPHRVVTAISSPIKVNYTYNGGNQGTIVVTTGDGQTYTQTLSSTNDPATNQWQPTMSVGASAATGGYKSNMGVQITKFNLQLATSKISVTFKDTDGKIIKSPKLRAITANTGDTVTVDNNFDATRAKYVYRPTKIPGYLYKDANILTVTGDESKNYLNLIYNKSYQKAILKISNPHVLPNNDPWRTRPQIVIDGPHTNDPMYNENVDMSNIFETSDQSATANTLKRIGYEYSVIYHHLGDPNDGVRYPTLAAALTENPKFDATDNNDSNDTNHQIYEIIYQPKGRTTLRAVPNFDFGINEPSIDETYFLAHEVNQSLGSVNILNLDYLNVSSGYPINRYLSTGNLATPVKRQLVVTAGTNNFSNSWHIEGKLSDFYADNNTPLSNSQIKLSLLAQKIQGIDDYPTTGSNSMWQNGGTPKAYKVDLEAGGNSATILTSNDGLNQMNAVGSWQLNYSSNNSAKLTVPQHLLAKIPRQGNKISVHSNMMWTLISGIP